MNHILMGGSDESADGIDFIANMPTEEIFTLSFQKGCKRHSGQFHALNYNGNLIEDFAFTFRDGEIIDIRVGRDMMFSNT